MRLETKCGHWRIVLDGLTLRQEVRIRGIWWRDRPEERFGTQKGALEAYQKSVLERL
jgi:hypothetical protein